MIFPATGLIAPPLPPVSVTMAPVVPEPSAVQVCVPATALVSMNAVLVDSLTWISPICTRFWLLPGFCVGDATTLGGLTARTPSYACSLGTGFLPDK